MNRLIWQVFSNIEKLSQDYEVVKIAQNNFAILIKHLTIYTDEANPITIQDKLSDIKDTIVTPRFDLRLVMS